MYGLNIKAIRVLAYGYAKAIGAEYPASWDEHELAGKDWYYSFNQRHRNLALRTPQQLSVYRSQGFQKENV